MKDQFQCKMKLYCIMRNHFDKDFFICEFIDMSHTQVSLVFFWRWTMNSCGPDVLQEIDQSDKARFYQNVCILLAKQLHL